MTMIDAARRQAEAAHRDQQRKGAAGAPYIGHVAEVARLVAAWGASEPVVAAAWLHDVVEDCGVSLASLEAAYGAEVASLVAEVTDDKTLPKAERKRLQVVNAGHKSVGAALIKLADKLSNVAEIGREPPMHWDEARMLAYVEWAETVVAGLPALPATGMQQFREAAATTRAAIRRRGEAGRD